MRRRPYRIHLFSDQVGRWRFHIIAANGSIVATSGESFASKGNAKRAAKRLAKISEWAVE